MEKKTIIRVGLENNMDGRSVAWALDYMGCYAHGINGRDALLKIPSALLEYRDWISKHNQDSWLQDLKDFDVRLEETFTCYFVDENFRLAKDGYEVDAWFLDDWRPLTRLETQRGLKVMVWSREELLKILEPVSPEVMDRTYQKERWSIRGIIGHIASAEHWYMDRLDKAGVTRRELPEGEIDRLAAVRERLIQILPELEGVEHVVGKEGDHIKHIQKLLDT
jgi:hypothetical protein